MKAGRKRCSLFGVVFFRSPQPTSASSCADSPPAAACGHPFLFTTHLLVNITPLDGTLDTPTPQLYLQRCFSPRLDPIPASPSQHSALRTPVLG